jgi:hypothetical protein
MIHDFLCTDFMLIIVIHTYTQWIWNALLIYVINNWLKYLKRLNNFTEYGHFCEADSRSATSWLCRGSSPGRGGNVSLHHRVHTGTVCHPASYPMGTRGSFPGGKATGAWSWPLTSI